MLTPTDDTKVLARATVYAALAQTTTNKTDEQLAERAAAVVEELCAEPADNPDNGQ